MRVIELLVERQKGLGITDPAFARLIGINRGDWSKYKRGLRRPGLALLRAAVSAFPEMREALGAATVATVEAELRAAG